MNSIKSQPKELKTCSINNPLQLISQFSSVAQSCPLCNTVDCIKPGFPVHHQLMELVQTHVHPSTSDAIQTYHPLPSLLLLYSVFPSTRVFSFFSIYFYQLEANYFTILQWFLSYIDMNQPWIYVYSPSRCPLPPPSLPDPSGSSQCTRPEHLSHASNLGSLWEKVRVGCFERTTLKHQGLF